MVNNLENKYRNGSIGKVVKFIQKDSKDSIIVKFDKGNALIEPNTWNEGTAQHNCVGTYTDVGRKEHSAFLEFTYAGLIHTVQVDYNKENDDYLIVQMYSSMNQPNATGAEEELQKIINKK